MVKYLKALDDRLVKLQECIPDENWTEYASRLVALRGLFIAQDSFQQKAMKREDWWTVKELDGKPVNYTVAMLAEIGELLKSADYEWWAIKENKDVQNMITELIDALHFDLSKCMQVFEETALKNNWSESVKTEKAISIIIKLADYSYNHIEDKLDSSFYKQLVNYVAASSNIENAIEYGFEEFQYPSVFAGVISELFLTLELLGIEFDEIVARYQVKNALNFVRKANGYKEGTYIKHWLSIGTGIQEEDNVIALELVLGKDYSYDEIIQVLDGYYKENILPLKDN